MSKWFGILKSVMASFFGVQTQEQYVKDANMNSVIPFVVVGFIMVVVLVLAIWMLVQVLVSAN